MPYNTNPTIGEGLTNVPVDVNTILHGLSDKELRRLYKEIFRSDCSGFVSSDTLLCQVLPRLAIARSLAVAETYSVSRADIFAEIARRWYASGGRF